MKASKQLSLKSGWLCAVACALACASPTATSQTFTVLKSFGNLTSITGLYPQSQLVQGPDGTLYGTTSSGEGNVAGTVFKIQPDGSGFAVLKWFTNSLEGKSPIAGLTLSDSVLYGTTYAGGSSDRGTVFKLNTDGTDYAVLKHFTVSDGGNLQAELTLSGSVLYGTTPCGGSADWGTVFKLNTDGTGYTVLKEFGEDGTAAFVPTGRLTLSGDALYGQTAGGRFTCCFGTIFKINTDGTGFSTLKNELNPVGGLTLSDGVLYGTTGSGGSSNAGTVFKLNTDGTGYTVLKEFSGSDGAAPSDDLILLAGVLYGTTGLGGNSNSGTVFKLNTDGTGYAALKHFAGSPSDGGAPGGGLTLVDGVLCGTTSSGGSFYAGTVFKVNTDGTGFAVLKEFGVPIGEAVSPGGGLVLSGGMLYGTTSRGGDSGRGTVFRANTDGTSYTVLKHFSGFPGDGAAPGADLILSDGLLYGTTRLGGSSNSGTVFKMNTDGTGYQVLKAFSESEGVHPRGGLTLSASVLYGTTAEGGSSNVGTVFKINADGTVFQVLKEFSGSDGAYPLGGLALSGSVLYGATSSGGSSNAGTVFKVNTDGTDYAVLRHFALSSSEGAYPIAGVTAIDGVLYGTTGSGGDGSASGSLFKMNTDGTGFTVLRSFGGIPGDGRQPSSVLAVFAGVLYGTTVTGGWTTDGTLFRIRTDGTGYAVLKQFAGSDGAFPFGRLTISDGALYGTTYAGGSFDLGTVFKLELSTPCSLSGQTLDRAIVLSWSNPAYDLQAAPALTGTFTNIHGATSPYTNAIVGPKQFFRLVGGW